MFAATVRRAPGRVAIHYRDEALTFARPRRALRCLRRRLAQRGVGRGDRVALYLQNVPEFVVAVLGTWKPGAIAVSVNPMLKEREVRTLLDDCAPVALVTLESLFDEVARDAVAGTSVRSSSTDAQVARAGARARRAGAARPRPRARRRRLPDLHVGHDGAAEGRDEHPPQRRLQLAGLPRLGRRQRATT